MRPFHVLMRRIISGGLEGLNGVWQMRFRRNIRVQRFYELPYVLKFRQQVFFQFAVPKNMDPDSA
jgi:hypothetical protein